MPLKLTELDGGIGTLTVAEGSVMAADFLAIINEQFTADEARFKKRRYNITDLSGLTETDIRSEQIQSMKQMGAAAAEQLNPDRVFAIVAPTDLSFGLSRMLEMMASQISWEIMVFRSRPEAETWIRERVKERFGIENLTLEPTR